MNPVASSDTSTGPEGAMDKANLERLRRKYGSANADDIHDPAMRKLSEALFAGPGRRRLTYGGVPTLLDAPYN